MTQQYMGSVGGVTGKTQGMYETDKRRPDADYFAAIAHMADVNFIITGEHSGFSQSQRSIVDANVNDNTLVFVPGYEVSAGAGSGVEVDHEKIRQTFAFRRDWLRSRSLRPEYLSVITVQGDSMAPRLQDGDIVLLNQQDTEVKTGKAYVVRIDNELLVKLAQRLPGDRLQLSSANPDYPPFIVDATNAIDIIGRVVCSSHEW